MRPIPSRKITLAEMKASGAHDLIAYCTARHCGHWVIVSADRWRDDVRLSDLEPHFVCSECGSKGADIRPHWPHPSMGVSAR
jgi:hypothetical protein